jgi:hypothetical protein
MIVVGTEPTDPTAVVNTQNWPYPYQMVDSIKQIANMRIADIRAELEEFGLSGLDQPPRPPPPGDLLNQQSWEKARARREAQGTSYGSVIT